MTILGGTVLGSPLLEEEVLIDPQALIDRLAKASDKPLTFLLEVDGLDKAPLEDAEVTGDYGLLEMPLLDAEGGIGVIGPMKTFKFATRPWIGRVDDGLRQNVDYQPRIKRGVSWEATLPLAPTEPRRSALSIGSLPLAIPPGALADEMAATAFRSRGSRGYILRSDDYFEQAVAVFGAVNKGITWQSRSVPQLEVAEAEFRLRRQLQRVFSGLGGIYGDGAAKGKPQPLSFGRVFNIPGQLLSDQKWVWWLHSRGGQELLDARDRGVSLIAGAVQFPSWEALWDADPGMLAGTVGYHLGTPTVVRFGNAPADPDAVRFDLKGDLNAAGEYTEAIGAIIARWCNDFGNVGPGALRVDTLSQFLPDTAGWYFSSAEQPTLGEALNAILTGLYGWFSTALDLKFEIAPILLTSETDPAQDIVLGREDCLKFGEPELVTPMVLQTAGYRKNWAPLTREQISSSVWEENPEFAAELAGTGQTLEVDQGFVALRTGDDAQDGEFIQTPYWDSLPARRTANRILKTFDGEKALIEIEVGAKGLICTVGKRVRFSYDAAGLGTRRWLVVHQRVELGGANQLTLYG